MEREGVLRSKALYKALLIFLKIIPMFIAICYMLNTIFAYVDIDIPVLSNLAGMSLSTWMFIYLASIVFKFCTYHRIFLYYILLTDLINIIDYYINIPITDYDLIIVHIIIIGLTLIIATCLYVKNHKRATHKNNR